MWAGPIMQSIVMLDSFDKRRREYKRLGWGLRCPGIHAL